MKKVISTLALAFAFNTVAAPAYACTITPLGDTRLRMEALLNAFDETESLQELTTDIEIYRVVTFNHSTLKTVESSYQLVNTSAMCPIYEARKIR